MSVDIRARVDQIIEDRKLSWQSILAIKFIKCGNIPKHISIIMDGNRRYAKKRDIDLTESYLRGFKKLIQVMLISDQLGIKEISVFAFSIENFKRNEKEVNFLMDLGFEIMKALKKNKLALQELGVRFCADTRFLSVEHQKIIAEYKKESAKYSPRIHINVCGPYTARSDITRSVDMLTNACLNNKTRPEQITQNTVQQCLSTHFSLTPEILVRTSGEIRFSDYMLWEANHSMLAFFPKTWPNLSPFDLLSSILEFQLKSSGQNLESNFTKWTNSNDANDHQEIIKQIKQFNKECELNHDQLIMNGKGYKKEIPPFENR